MFLSYYACFLSVSHFLCLNDAGECVKIYCLCLLLIFGVACASKGGTCCFCPSEWLSPRRK